MSDDSGPMCVQPVARQADNTLDTGTIPIIFAPGIMGSRLHFTAINRYWDPDHMIRRMPYWLTSGAETVRRAFALSNPAVVMSEGDGYTQQQLERGWAGVAKDFYRGLLVHLSGRRFGAYATPVYAIGYDWRQNNNDSGDAIMRRIAEILEIEHASRYILLSHSMGGLATRAGLKRNPAVAAKALGVCHIAQPATGAAVAARRMFTGATNAGDGMAMMLLLGNNRQKFATIASALPGAIQLLPTQDFTDTNGGPWYSYETFEQPGVVRNWTGMAWDLYVMPQSPPGLLAPAGSPHAIEAVPRREMLRRIAEARAFHLGLGLYKHEETWTFFGDGNTTDTRLHFRLPPQHTELAVWTTAFASLGGGMGGGGMGGEVFYTARRADGSEATIPGSMVDPMDRGCVLTQTNRTDGTVPIASAKGLFPGQAHRYARGAEHDLEAQRQFFHFGGAAHDMICTDGPTLAFLDELITHLVGSA
jgi:hypothetical protein